VELSDKPMKLLQISDLHFGPPFVARAAEAALRKAFDLNPDAIIINGDLTQRAKRVQFEAAKQYMQRLPQVPQLVIPGNHDVPLYRVVERLSDPHRLYREIISKELNPVLKIDGAVIVGLDSTAPRTAISNGRLRDWQLDLCERTFNETPKEMLKIIVAHHPFIPAPDSLRDRIMPSAKRAMKRIAEWNVDLILGGHLHRSYVGNSLDFYPGSQQDRGIIIAHCGTTTSSRGRGREHGRNTLNQIDVTKQAITVTHFMYVDESDSFEEVSRHVFWRL
jgi:3',5'-cyclic AMP phosphodiesterase CpdA